MERRSVASRYSEHNDYCRDQCTGDGLCIVPSVEIVSSALDLADRAHLDCPGADSANSHTVGLNTCWIEL